MVQSLINPQKQDSRISNGGGGRRRQRRGGMEGGGGRKKTGGTHYREVFIKQVGLEPHCQLCEYSLARIVIPRILQKFPPKLIYFLCSNIKKTVSWALQFHPYCPSKDLRQISTKNFFGFQKVLQKIVSGTRWFDPYHPFKNLI